MESPHFFVDRSLGAVQVPQLLRDAGWLLTTLVEHYGKPADESVADVDWLTLCGEQGCPVLMKDEKIRYRAAEREALLVAGVTALPRLGQPEVGRPEFFKIGRRLYTTVGELRRFIRSQRLAAQPVIGRPKVV